MSKNIEELILHSENESLWKYQQKNLHDENDDNVLKTVMCDLICATNNLRSHK